MVGRRSVARARVCQYSLVRPRPHLTPPTRVCFLGGCFTRWQRVRLFKMSSGAGAGAGAGGSRGGSERYDTRKKGEDVRTSNIIGALCACPG